MTKTYQQQIKDHLHGYRSKVLKVADQGSWRGLPYPHILPRNLKHLNILPTIRSVFLEYLAARPLIKLHNGFHHLNSSQAMTFNLLLPLFLYLPACNAVFPLDGISDKVLSVELEHVFPEDQTNADGFFVRQSGSHTLIELKYTESGFGSAVANERRATKLERIYAPRLRGCVGDECLEPAFFLKNYQLMRNLFHLHLDRDDRLILVFPRDNSSLAHCEQFFEEHISEALRTRVTALPLDVLVSRIEKALVGEQWREHYRLFREKYLPVLIS